MAPIASVVEFLKRVAPLDLAEEWDNVGLLLGDPADKAEPVMTCLTVTSESAAEAIERNVGLIVSHHPILFRATKKLTAPAPETGLVLALARAGVAVYSPHTAYDNAPGGINDLLANQLGLEHVRPLRRAPGAAQCKIVVFVPAKDLTPVSEAMFAAGAGHIGQYSQCGFRLEGTGTFFGSDASNPSIGQKGRREEVAEVRLEVVCPMNIVDTVVAALRRAHSYEEPAYDIYPLRPAPTRGVGRIGELITPKPLGEFAQFVKTTLQAPGTQVVGDAARLVKRIALVCGSGGEFWPDAFAQKADVLLTGEARFHDCLASRANGLGLVLPGHHASERGGVEVLALRIREEFPNLEVWASAAESDPLAPPS